METGRDIEVDREPSDQDGGDGGNGGNGGRGRGRRPRRGNGDGNGGSRTAARSRGGSDELHDLLSGLRELSAGNFDVRLPRDGDPLLSEIADAFNSVAELNQRTTNEIVRELDWRLRSSPTNRA